MNVLYLLPLDLVSTVQIENTKINNFIIYKLNSVSGVSSFSFKCSGHMYSASSLGASLKFNAFKRFTAYL